MRHVRTVWLGLAAAAILAGCGCSATPEMSPSPTSTEPPSDEKPAASAEATPSPPSGGFNVGTIVLGDETPTTPPVFGAPAGTAAASAAAASDRGTDAPPPKGLPERAPSGGAPPAKGASAGASAPNSRGGSLQSAVVDSGKGLSEADIRTAVSARSAMLRMCYSMGAADDAAFRGTVTVRASIGPTGVVANLEVLTSTTKNAKVDGCVMDALRGTQFPATGSGGIASIPIELGQ